MPNPAGAHWDDGLTFWDDGSTYDSATTLPAPELLTPVSPIPLNSTTTTMEYWEITKNRAQETLPVWTQHAATLTIGGKTPTDLETLIDGFEPLAQERTAAQDDYDAAFRTIQDALQRMKVLGTKVPAIIQGQLDENTLLMKDVDDLFRTSPRTESTILKRLRELLSVWERADAAMAAMTPPQPPITRSVGGTVYGVAAAQTLLDSFTGLVKTKMDKEELLDMKRAALQAHDDATDSLNKRWYKTAKAIAEPGDGLFEGLEGITTESGTPAPVPIEIDTIAQGGENGLEVQLTYVPGGGAHATTKLVRWQIVGVDPDYLHEEPLDEAGNLVGPFTPGQTIRLIAEVSNSSGTRTSAPRTIVIEEPVD